MSYQFWLCFLLQYAAAVHAEVWFPVFMAFEQNGMPVYESWKTPNMCNDLPTVFGKAGHGRHLRSHVIDHWKEINIKMVKVQLFKKNEVVAWMTFNARNTNNLNWFSKSNLYQSSFTDLSPCSVTNYFSAFGHFIKNGHTRNFYINKSYGGCPADLGWFVVLDAPDFCGWAKYSKYPVFKYTKDGRSWVKDSDTGDTLVISIAIDL